MAVTLKEIFKSNLPFENSHKAEALFFSCCDFRFRSQVQEFLGNKKIDPFVFPGGIMLFVGGKHGHPDMKESSVYWTKALAQLHHAKKIYLTVHGKSLGKCGAYATAPALQGKSPDELYEIQMGDVLETKNLLEKEIPGIEVVMIYMEAGEDGLGVTFSEIVA